MTRTRNWLDFKLNHGVDRAEQPQRASDSESADSDARVPESQSRRPQPELGPNHDLDQLDTPALPSLECCVPLSVPHPFRVAPAGPACDARPGSPCSVVTHEGTHVTAHALTQSLIDTR